MGANVFTYIGAFAVAYWLVFVLFERLERRKDVRK